MIRHGLSRLWFLLDAERRNDQAARRLQANLDSYDRGEFVSAAGRGSHYAACKTCGADYEGHSEQDAQQAHDAYENHPFEGGTRCTPQR